MTTKALYKNLFRIVIPIAFQYLMSSLVTASDTFMLGLLDQQMLSASSLAGQIAFVYSLFFGAFVYGCNVIAAQYWGKGDTKTVSQALSITMHYALLVGLVFTLATLICPKLIMHAFTNDVQLVDLGADYLRTVSLSYVLTGFSQAYFGIMKICNKAGTSSIIGSSAVVVNILLNGLFIFGLGPVPAMGITGAALATVLSRVFEVVCILIIVKKTGFIRLNVKDTIRLKNKVLVRDYWKYTVPILLNQLGWGLGVTMYSVIMGHLGTDATAANSIAGTVRSMIASLCWGIASGVSIIIGGMLGRNEIDQAKKAAGRFVRLSIWIGVVSGVVILLLTPLVLKIMQLEPVANGYLKGMMMMAAYYIIGNSLNSTIITGVFVAGGDTKFGMYCDIITLWAVVVPLGFITAFWLNAPVLVVAAVLTLDEFVKIPVVYKHYMKYLWARNITQF